LEEAMLRISAEQMSVFEMQVETNFARRLAHTLIEAFPFRFVAGGVELPEEFALACARHAKDLGLRSESAITRYANLCTLIGLGFENKPFADNTGLSPTSVERLDPEWLDRIVPMVEELLRNRSAT
jgi:hypothetical protein